MREVYRIHQDFVQDLFTKNVFGFHGAFLARKSGLTFSQIQKDMVPLLEQVRDRLLSFEDRLAKAGSPSDKENNSETKQT